MPPDPRTLFGGLLSVCVSDDYLKDKKAVAEGVVFVALGAASSIVTTYFLSAAGFLL